MNLLRLFESIPDKVTAVAFLQNKGIIHAVRLCDNGHAMRLSLSDKEDRWRCYLKDCRKDIPLRKGTWLEGSKLPYRTIILFIYCWSYELSSVSFCERELEINHNAVVDYNNYLREVCAWTLIQNPVIPIGGPGMVVEIDESMFSRRKNNVGRVLAAQWVFGGICRQTSECFLYAVSDRSANTLLPIIQTCVRPGTTIMSDLWAAYNGMQNLPQYTHLTVNHSIQFINPVNGANTQKIESTWNQAKQRNKRHSGTARQMIDSYLCEFLWRKRVGARNSFDEILTDISMFWPPN